MDGFHIHFNKFPECRAAPENAEIVAEIVARLVEDNPAEQNFFAFPGRRSPSSMFATCVERSTRPRSR